jgi:hypothetical protein
MPFEQMVIKRILGISEPVFQGPHLRRDGQPGFSAHDDGEFGAAVARRHPESQRRRKMSSIIECMYIGRY